MDHDLLNYYSDEKLEADAIKFNLPVLTIRRLNNWYFCDVIRAFDDHPDKKNNCLCYLAMHRYTFFERLMKQNIMSDDDIIECANIVPNILICFRSRIKKDEVLREKIIASVKPDWYDYLPSDIAKDPIIMEKCNRTKQVYGFRDRDSDGYNKDWINRKGELISFFHLEGNFPIRTKTDYYRLYKEYLESKMSIKSFCRKFRIEPIEGFEKFLSRIKAESFEESNMISDTKNTVKKNFWNASNNDAVKLANGELSFEEFFNKNAIILGSANIEIFCWGLSRDDRSKFSIHMIDYFEKNYPIFPQVFIDYLTTKGKNAVDNYNYYIRGGLMLPKDRKYYPLYYNQEAKLKKQLINYNRKNTYCTWLINDKKYEVDDNIIDQALIYARDMKYHICQSSIASICKKIVLGELDYSHETIEQKDEIIDVIINLIAEEKTIEDYINTFKNSKKSL